ncbi:MAG: GNAT family N-acetyltransferase [Clostridiales bacterium]|nr:GNAT family N-acetyltransferase [Clostridiales bacterium]
MIRKAEKRDVEGVWQGYRDVLSREEKNGKACNWSEGLYPTRNTAEKGLEEGTLYVLEEEGEICASLIINSFQPEFYKNINWLFLAEEDETAVIHTLCVSPEKSGRGLGRRCVIFAEGLAKEKGCKVIRFDTWAENKPAQGLYEGLGYRYAGRQQVLFEGVIPEELKFYEKSI